MATSFFLYSLNFKAIFHYYFFLSVIFYSLYFIILKERLPRIILRPLAAYSLSSNRRLDDRRNITTDIIRVKENKLIIDTRTKFYIYARRAFRLQ